MDIRLRTLPLLLLAALPLCGASAGEGNVRKYVIRASSPEQTVEHFGASDAWSMQFIGLWPDDEQRKVADWLFSTENDANGQPRGIGLSVWRFNLGAGSEEQGDSSQINPGTRTQCLLRADGTYDWSRQPGQRCFLRLAKERGVPYILAFLNSAPVHFTANGLATNTGRGGTINLRNDRYEDFARFIATAIKGIEEHDGIRIDYVSPVNEPDGHWNWLGPKQEGSPATNREIARLVRETDRQLTRQKLDTKIIVNESSDLRCLIGTHETDWTRGNTISTLFSADSTDTYLGRLSHVPHLMAGHSYWTNTPLDFMREVRLALRDSLRKYGLDFWQTEICIMGNDEEIGGGGGYDHSMRTALYVARVIHSDMVFANARSWSWWRAVGGDYKDGLLRAYSADGMRSGTVTDSKLLWTLGNYSRFVRPGAVRHAMTATTADGTAVDGGCDDMRGVMCSAYRNKDGAWTVVAINYSEESKPFDLAVDDGAEREWIMYRTSDILAENLKPVGTTMGTAVLAPRSVTTFVSKKPHPASPKGR